MYHPVRSTWPFAAACFSLIGAVLIFSFAVYVSTWQPSIALPPPRPDPTFPAAIAAPVVPTYPVDAHGYLLVSVITPTPTAIPPTPTVEPYVWPTATAIRDYSGQMDVGGRT